MARHLSSFLLTLSVFILGWCNGMAQSISLLPSVNKQASLHSEILNEDRAYWISFPKSYHLYSQQHYPVIYLLDADVNFAPLLGIQQFLTRGTFPMMPEMIIVGILNTDRTRDLTPTHVRDTLGKPQKGGSYAKSGGADKFVAFVHTELMPVINKQYRTLDYTILAGHSFGGLTAIHTLLKYPHYFNAYVAMDPSLWWDSEVMLSKLDSLKQNQSFSGRQLYLTSSVKVPAGNFNTAAQQPDATQRFVKSLRDSELKTFGYRYFEDESHGTVALPSMYYGLKFLFDGYQQPRSVTRNPDELTLSFRRFKEKIGVNIAPPEYLTEALGNSCIETNDLKNAIAFYQISVTNYPDSKRALKFLAEAYERDGQKEKAATLK